jgi:16S rRNA (adenine1518-N6/adenine1519-N6)-dimethyltransferase
MAGKERREAVLQLLTRCGIEPSRRGETLSLEEFARISRAMLEEGWS